MGTWARPSRLVAKRRPRVDAAPCPALCVREAARFPHFASRATVDIDVNVFVDAARTGDVLCAFAALGIDLDEPAVRALVERDGQARIFWERTPIELFFSYDPLHLSSMDRRRRVDFGEDRIHILGAEDLIVYKVVFDREKDWRDIAEMIHAANQPPDFAYARDWLDRLIDSGGA